jgi:hypothetical protein
MAAEMLRKVGWALIAVGLLDIGVMVYCVVNNMSYSSSFNIFAVVAGIFLLRQSMRAARVVSFFAAFMLPPAIVVGTAFPLLGIPKPLLTQLRANPVSAVLTEVVVISLIVFLFWVYRNLTSTEVMEARRAAGVGAETPRLGWVAGIAFAVGSLFFFGLMPKLHI